MAKKIFLGNLLLLIGILTGCSGKEYLFVEPIDEIESIEIVSAESSLEYEVIKILSQEEKQIFLDRFQKLPFRDYLGDPPSVYGRAIKINYQSGAYEMICFFSSEYVQDGVTRFLWKRCDEQNFNELLDAFLQ